MCRYVFKSIIGSHNAKSLLPDIEAAQLYKRRIQVRGATRFNET
jgi:hypothetical protein